MALRWLMVLTVLVGLLGGCGGNAGPELAPAHGTITLNGQPLKGARVTFVSQREGGSIGIGTTDAEGHYQIGFTATRMGAPVGPTLVRISKMVRDPAPRVRAEQEGEEGGGVADGDDGEVPKIDLVPPKYNAQSELKIEVQPGKAPYDFDL